ncbi:hypothetical protein [Desulfobacter hydrogenophilus]|uniref:hypothetical protein n=1 Tax=Desulfobacter hydrogenophilus TaxID=2291 RepID=UPI001A93CA57|nr:hypothetical protein [Desulfobacter hydrogenophilus]
MGLPGDDALEPFIKEALDKNIIENGYIDLVSEMQPYLLGYFSVDQIALTKKYGFIGLAIDTGGALIHKDKSVPDFPDSGSERFMG